MMTCIYDAWSARLGHNNIKLQIEPIWSPELFCDYRHVDPDEEKVQKVNPLRQAKNFRKFIS